MSNNTTTTIVSAVVYLVALTLSVIDDCCIFFFFFFQAEDGIRDYKVTGVQTCALPICSRHHGRSLQHGRRLPGAGSLRRCGQSVAGSAEENGKERDRIEPGRQIGR